MIPRPGLDRWLQESEWVADRDPGCSPDAMRWHPTPTVPLSCEPGPLAGVSTRPAPDPEQIRRLMLEANARWIAVGRGYHELGTRQPSSPRSAAGAEGQS